MKNLLKLALFILVLFQIHHAFAEVNVDDSVGNKISSQVLSELSKSTENKGQNSSFYSHHLLEVEEDEKEDECLSLIFSYKSYCFIKFSFISFSNQILSKFINIGSGSVRGPPSL
jgi:hypothetical protein